MIKGAACAILVASFAFAGSGAGFAAEPQPPANLPDLQTLAQPKKQSLRKARQELLTSLYDQLRNSQSEEAAELIVSAIEKLWSQSGSDTATLLMERAGIAIKSRDYDMATSILTALTDVEPRYVEGWNQLATIYFLREDYSNAMIQLRRVLTLDPHHFKAIEGLSIILRESGRKDAALKATRRVLAIHPHLKSAQQAEEELAREVEGQGI